MTPRGRTDRTQHFSSYMYDCPVETPQSGGILS